jgi:N6-adenosine-specific RNA methylase IME4
VVKAIAENPHAATNAASEVRRQERIGKLIEAGTPSMAGELGRFALIYADPPWRYEHPVSDSRDIENQYPTMALVDICALPVGRASFAGLRAFALGAEFEASRGHGSTERLGLQLSHLRCMGQRGDRPRLLLPSTTRTLVAGGARLSAPAPSDRVASVIQSRRRAHSEKPQLVYEIIERMYPALPKLELFARGRREGWSAWGNQAAA